MIAILGAGISGISAGYHLSRKGIENTVFEKRNRWGGLCDNFTIRNGFRFDYFVHLSFAKGDAVKSSLPKAQNIIHINLNQPIITRLLAKASSPG